MKAPLCVCIGCGCDDQHACPDLFGDPCGWFVQSGTRKLGVCTQCGSHLKRWTQGQRSLSDAAKEAIAERRLRERLARPRRRSS